MKNNSPDEVFSRLAQLRYDTSKRLDQIQELTEANRKADIEHDQLAAEASRILQANGERVVIASAWNGHSHVPHAIFDVDGSVEIRETIEAWQLQPAACEPDCIRLPGRDGHHGPTPCMRWEDIAAIDNAVS